MIFILFFFMQSAFAQQMPLFAQPFFGAWNIFFIIYGVFFYILCNFASKNSSLEKRSAKKELSKQGILVQGIVMDAGMFKDDDNVEQELWSLRKRWIAWHLWAKLPDNKYFDFSSNPICSTNRFAASGIIPFRIIFFCSFL